MIKYRTSYDLTIEPVSIVSETEHFVLVETNGKARREAKVSSWGQFHDSWRHAKEFLVAREQQNVEYARHALELAKSKFGNAKGMREPK